VRAAAPIVEGERGALAGERALCTRGTYRPRASPALMFES
jgi:hypothetical protein